MDPQGSLLEELSSGDLTKQSTAIVRLLQISANGRDATIYFPAILKHVLAAPEQKAARIIAYHFLRTCHLTDHNWDAILPLLAKDIQGDDLNLLIAALQVVVEIPPQLMLIDFVERIDFAVYVNHNNSYVRRLSVEILSTLLLHRLPVATVHSFVQHHWRLIVTRIFEDSNPCVFQQAFKAVALLFSTLSRINHSGSFGEENSFMVVVKELKALLIPNLDLLLKRIELIVELPYRIAASELISLLQEDCGHHSNSSYPVVIVRQFADHSIIPYIANMDESVAYVASKVVLSLQKDIESHRVDWVINAALVFVSMLKREVVAISSSCIIMEILSVLHLIPDRYLLFCWLKLLNAIRDFTDTQQRQQFLLRVFELVVSKDLEGRDLLIPLLKDSWVAAVLKEEGIYREEIFLAIVSSFTTALPHIIGSDSFTSAMKFLQHGAICIQWDCAGRTYAIEQYVRFADWVLASVQSVTQENSSICSIAQQFLKGDFYDKIQHIVNDGICLQVMFVVCKYTTNLPIYENPEGSVLGTIRKRFLLLDEWSARRNMLSSLAKGGAFVDKMALRVGQPPSGIVQGVMEMLHTIAVRFSVLVTSVLKVFEEMTNIYSTNEGLVSRIAFYQQKLTSVTGIAYRPDVVNISVLPPIEVADGFDSTNDKFIVDFKMSAVAYNKQRHFIQQSKHQILSSSSDPFFIEASHFVDSATHSIIFRVQILNQIGFPYSNLELSVGLCGHVQFACVTGNTKQFKRVLTDEKVDIEFSLSVSGFDCNSAILHLSFVNSESPYSDDEIPGSVDGYEKHGEIVSFQDILSDPYIFDLSEFLIPLKYTREEFISLWSRFPVGFILDLAFDVNLDQVENIASFFINIAPFQQVSHLEYASGRYFQLSYASMTWFEEQLLFTIIGNRSATATASVRFEFRASKLSVLNAFHKQIDFWVKTRLRVPNPRYSLLLCPADIYYQTSDTLISSESTGTEEEVLQKWKLQKHVN